MREAYEEQPSQSSISSSTKADNEQKLSYQEIHQLLTFQSRQIVELERQLSQQVGPTPPPDANAMAERGVLEARNKAVALAHSRVHVSLTHRPCCSHRSGNSPFQQLPVTIFSLCPVLSCFRSLLFELTMPVRIM